MARKESDLLQEVSLSDIELTQARDPAYASHPEILSSPTSAASPQGFASGSVEAVPASGAPRVGRYELLLEIASGGMATVYIGRQFGAGGFERLVAIKRMHPHVAREPELAASFMDEARIASLIRHPNVVNVHDVHDADGEHLLVMDYVEGASLASVMRGARKRNERISRPAALRILVDALQGLHAAHEQCSLEGRPLSIVHRDATPHNILLGVDGSVRLTDFGIAKAAERSVNTAAGLAKGKFRYMAPEQARGGALDRRVDVFAMGIVAWELLTGARLFDAEGDGQVLLTITAGDYRKPTSVDPTIPADLEGIVMRALGLQPNDRYSSAQAFADAITAWGKQAGELASPSDVARLVHEFCGTDVSAKRKSLGEVLAGRRTPPALGELSVPGVTTGTGSSVGTSAPLTLDSVKIIQALTPEELNAYRAKRRMVVASAAVGGVVVASTLIVLAIWWSKAPAPPAQDGDAVTSIAASAAPVAASSEGPSERVRITIRADQGVSEVRGAGVGDIDFIDNGVTLSLPRSSQDTKLVVVFADGAEVEETISPKENMALRVRAVARPAEKPAAVPPPVAGPKPVAGPRPAPAAGKGPGLEDNPYE